MSLAERLDADYITAMKARDQRRVETLRMIKAAIQKTAMDKRKDKLDDPEVVQILGQQVKQRNETLDAAKQGGRQDIVTQSEQELALINAYLPQPLSPDAVKQLIDEAIQAVGPNQGQIMKFVMGKAAGAVDGKLVSQLVGERLKPG